MKIVLNTTEINAVASYNYVSALKKINNIKINYFDNYELYDIILFLSYKNDLKEIVRVKKKYPKTIIGIIDPRGSEVDKIVDFLDFIIIDSIEMKDFFSKYQLPIFTYSEYTYFDNQQKINLKNHEKTIIGYHGNKLHLIAMYPNVFKALELLAKKYSIEFWALYNFKKLGKLNFGFPKNLKVRHIQWSESNFVNELSKVDIGIVPSMMPINNLKNIKRKSSHLSNLFNESYDDYLVRYKMPSNPGRILSFAFLEIPVIADLIPSSLQLIKDGENGLLAYSVGGWYNALKSLITDHNLRLKMVSKMNIKLDDYTHSSQNKKLILFLKDLLENKKETNKPILEHFSERSLYEMPNFKIYILKKFIKKKIIKLFRLR